MKKPVSGGRLLLSMLKKDFVVYTRNAVYLFLTLLSLAFFVAIFWLVPDKVEEDFTFAISPPLEVLFSEGMNTLAAHGFPEAMLEQLGEVKESFAEEEGIVLVEFESEELLVKAVGGDLEVYRSGPGQYLLHDPEGAGKKPEGATRVSLNMGIALPSSFLSDAALGHEPLVKLYADAQVPEEYRGALSGFIRELAYQLAGRELPVEMPPEEAIILGVDRLGDQVSMRAKMRPLIAFFIMMMETFTLASLISNEVLQRTVTALLVTPVRVGHFLMAKTIFGTMLAVFQALLILLLVGAFTSANWTLLLTLVFLGSLLFTSVAMLVGSTGKDFIGQLMLSMLFIIPLMIPAFAVLFPGSVALWVSYLPSYPIVRLLYDVTIHGALWAEAAGYLLYACLWVFILYAASLLVLRRKVAAL